VPSIGSYFLNANLVTRSLHSVYINYKPKWKEVKQVRKLIIALGLTAVMLFSGVSFAADQTRTRSKDQARIHDRTRTREQQSTQTKDRIQTQDRVEDGSCKTTK